MPTKKELLPIDGREVAVSNPDKVYFPQAGITKLELVRYYLAVAEGALRGVRGRPMALKRFVNGAEGEFFFQKRAPDNRPDWIEVVELSFPSGRTAHEIVVRDAAQLAWVVNLGCIDLNPHPVRAEDLDHPDELRVDLDPVPGVAWSQIREVALLVREVLSEHGLVGWPKTSGSRGLHVYARIAPRWTYPEVRQAALALAREVERRAPSLATSKWWKEERHGVFIDYNQNAKDRTVASAYSVRPTPDARVSAPVTWEELPGCELGDFTLRTVPQRFARLGDPSAGIDEAVGSLESLLALAERQRAEGQGDAPWPPHYAKGEDEPPRVQPSRRRGAGGRTPKAPLVVVARAARREDALAGLEHWKQRYPAAAARLAPEDILVDAMRGRSTTWTRVRVNLARVPEEERPPDEPPDPDAADTSR
jgi:DNA ligase D-like protein (predicted polymerase)